MIFKTRTVPSKQHVNMQCFREVTYASDKMDALECLHHVAITQLGQRVLAYMPGGIVWRFKCFRTSWISNYKTLPMRQTYKEITSYINTLTPYHFKISTTCIHVSLGFSRIYFLDILPFNLNFNQLTTVCFCACDDTISLKISCKVWRCSISCGEQGETRDVSKIFIHHTCIYSPYIQA